MKQAIEAHQLLVQIHEKRQMLRQLEGQLQRIQANCDHNYEEKRTHRVCQNCGYVKNFHY